MTTAAAPAHSRLRAALLAAALLPACLLLGAAAAVLAGQDANWDLLNYHLYNGYALLHGRFHQDLVAAGMQSSLNPLLDAAYAWLALGPLSTHPRLLAATMGLWYGALIYLAWRLARLLHPGPVPAAAGVLLGVTGVAAVSQLGTTTNEIQGAVVMLAGLLLLLRAGPAAPPGRTVLAAGLLFGAAAGLKLTAVGFAPAAGLAVAALLPPRRWPAAFALFGAGWLAGLLVTDGWWGWMLHQRFGSPTFPMFNGVFRSPWYPPASLLDDRFLPRGLVQWLTYPYHWLVTGGPSPGELPVRDPRFALALALCVLALPTVPRLPPVQRAAVVFFAVGYACWLGTSAIIRYAVVIEVMAGLLVPLLLARLLPPSARSGALAALVALVLLGTRQPATFRVPYGARAFEADMGWVQPGTLLVVTASGPATHVVAGLQRQDVEVLNLGDTVLEARGWPLHDVVERKVRTHPGPIVVVLQGHLPDTVPELREIGLDPAVSDCRDVASTFVPAGPAGIHACTARRRPRTPLPSPFWAQAARRYRTVMQPRDRTGNLFGATYLDSAGPAARGTRFIDWSDLLWSGVRNSGAPLPQRIDPGTLYIVAPEHLAALQALLGPTDVLGRVDGQLVLAPGWGDCAACTAPLEPVPFAGPPPLRIGDTVPLGPAATASGLLTTGWWDQEPAGIWSKEEAGLTLPLAPGLPDGAVLVLRGHPFTGPGRTAQRVVVDVPGQPGSERQQTLTGPGAIRLPIRSTWTIPGPGRTRLTLRLRLPDAASPAQLGMSIDPRRLGLSAVSLSLEAPDPP